ESNIRNYSIWLHEGEQRLFGYWEYHGDDFAADMQKMADDPITKKWWAVCKPCQAPLETRKEGEHWSMMEEVFYHDKK
ncbi:MAG: L-rhamnose mutarotase, partial [Deltaproteobacteria bacterium]